MNRAEQGRLTLDRWVALRPANAYEGDPHLRRILARRLGPERLAEIEPALRQVGADTAGPIDAAAAELDRAENLPRLMRWSETGRRTEEIIVHPLHHEVGRRVWRSGVLAALAEPHGVAVHAGLYYLLAQNGEVPHLCSLACTAGLVKAIQRAGTEWMRRSWLPRLLDRDYDRRWHGAQLLTEVQGGSDVAANACVATPLPGQPGTWHLSGEKWFCSNVAADLHAVSARPEGAPEGTAGLGLFIVPRRLEDGRVNGIHVRRLKSKLGTRTLPTAEVDLERALGFQLGATQDGFKLMMGVVINTSRLAVALGTSGIMRRAWLEASRYAELREAFGRRLSAFPAVREQLAEMRTLTTAGLALSLYAAAREDALAAAGVRPEDDPVFRTALTLAKFTCSTDAATVVHHAIEVLGGNGTIEDLSPLPRLYREVPVQESWEGPHNTLMSQLLRDALRGKTHGALHAAAEALLLGVERAGLVPTRDRALVQLGAVSDRLEALLRGDPAVAALHARRVLARLARVFQVALVLDEAQAEVPGHPAPGLPAMAELLLRRWATPGYEPEADPAYPGLVEAVLEA